MAVDFLAECKTRLGITHTYHDDLISALVSDVQAFLVSAGVDEGIVSSEEAVGCVARGVADLWNFGAGDGRLSPVFLQRAIQLATAGRQEE